MTRWRIKIIPEDKALKPKIIYQTGSEPQALLDDFNRDWGFQFEHLAPFSLEIEEAPEKWI